MKKEITMRQMATIKRVAQNVNPLIVKKSKLISKIDELEDVFVITSFKGQGVEQLERDD